MAKKMLSKIRGADIAKFRDDERARGLAENSIRLNIALLSHLFKVAATEWQMEGLENPCKAIEQPKSSNARTRRLVGDEESRLLAALPKAMPRTPEACALVVLAVETGMRESELLGLTRTQIRGRVAHLSDTKSGLPRDVPLSKVAAATIAAQPLRPDGKLFGVKQDGLVRGFRRACDIAGIADLKFHDLRHEAASRLAEIYEAHELAKIFGWKTIQMAMRYYHPRTEQLLSKMDAAAAARHSADTADMLAAAGA
jgi:integrase